MMSSVFVILFFGLLCIVPNFQQDELEFVAIIFRHGDRTPDSKATYPKDVHRNITFGIHGPGELTDQGRRRIYLLGKQLKKMYERYLGGNFTINNVRPVGTEYNRAKDSMELVLNALFDNNEDFDNLKHFNYEIAFMRNNTEEFGLSPPTWLSDVKDHMVAAISDYLVAAVSSSDLNRLFGGFLLREILNNIDIQIKTSKKQILYLYSGHDLNIVGLLGAMNTFHPHVPVYAACLVVELHKIRNSYYVKVLYQQNVTIGFKEIDLPGCSTLCPLGMFKDIVQKNIADENDSCH